MKLKVALTTVCYFIQSIVFCQENDSYKWKGIPNHKVDTTIDITHITGIFKNSLRDGLWTYSNGERESKEYYFQGKRIQLQEMNGNVVTKWYTNYTLKKSYKLVFKVKNSIIELYANINNLSPLFEKTPGEDWYGGSVSILKDTTYGLKKLTDSTFTDKNNIVYPIMFSKLSVQDHEWSDQQIIANEDESFGIKKTIFKLEFTKKMEFDKDDKLKSFTNCYPVVSLSDERKTTYSLKSTREDKFIINNNSTDSTINYQCRIDKNLVINGFFNIYGLPEGEWNLFHYPYYNLKDEKETAAFSLKDVLDIRLEQKVSPPSFEDMIDLKNLSSKTSENILEIFTNDNRQEYFVGINQPLKYTKFATFSQLGQDIGLEDKKGYYLFQNIKFKNGKLNSGFMYNPDGNVYDSINLNKDDFGETITKNETFKAFPAHPMAQKVQENLVKGLNLLITEAYKQRLVNNAQDWKNITCTQCNKPLTQSSAIVVEGIDCNNVRYPGGGNFCSNKCKFDYEKGYCRNK